MIEAHDASGCSDERALKDMTHAGPPFLFAGHMAVEVGFQFTIGEQPFTVTRMCSREEFDERQRRIGSTLLPTHPVVCYFEAATD